MECVGCCCWCCCRCRCFQMMRCSFILFDLHFYTRSAERRFFFHSFIYVSLFKVNIAYLFVKHHARTNQDRIFYAKIFISFQNQIYANHQTQNGYVNISYRNQSVEIFGKFSTKCSPTNSAIYFEFDRARARARTLCARAHTLFVIRIRFMRAASSDVKSNPNLANALSDLYLYVCRSACNQFTFHTIEWRENQQTQLLLLLFFAKCF